METLTKAGLRGMDGQPYSTPSTVSNLIRKVDKGLLSARNIRRRSLQTRKQYSQNGLTTEEVLSAVKAILKSNISDKQKILQEILAS